MSIELVVLLGKRVIYVTIEDHYNYCSFSPSPSSHWYLKLEWFISSAGRTGTAISFLTPSAIPKLHAIEHLTEKKLEALEGIDEKDVLLIMSKVGKAMRVANEFLLKNGFEEKEVKRKSRKPQLREETKDSASASASANVNGENKETKGKQKQKGKVASMK